MQGHDIRHRERGAGKRGLQSCCRAGPDAYASEVAGMRRKDVDFLRSCRDKITYYLLLHA
jgi:hypothetical protein